MDGETVPSADWKVGVDMGGTFIHFLALETRSGEVASLKGLTTPDDPGSGLMTGLSLLAEREGRGPKAVTRFVHGKTIGVDTIIRRKGAPLALFKRHVGASGVGEAFASPRLRFSEMPEPRLAHPEAAE